MKAISSRDNPYFKRLKKLAGSSRERRKEGLALLDGVHLVEACLAAGNLPRMIVVSESGAAHPEIAVLLERTRQVEQLLLPDPLFSMVSPVETPSGILALVDIPQLLPPNKPQFALLLEDIQDPGNLGTLLRSAAAAGVEVAWLSAGCADAWSPKVLRAGMGAHFVMPILERKNLHEVAGAFSGATLATSLAAQRSLYDTDLTGAVAFMAGNEGSGLSEGLLSCASAHIKIPMPGKMESMNVAAATSICLFERVRQCTNLGS